MVVVVVVLLLLLLLLPLLDYWRMGIPVERILAQYCSAVLLKVAPHFFTFDRSEQLGRYGAKVFKQEGPSVVGADLLLGS